MSDSENADASVATTGNCTCFGLEETIEREECGRILQLNIPREKCALHHGHRGILQIKPTFPHSKQC